MTRETKIGLLIATGIILLIGIVISDHLSVVKKQESANVGNLATDTQQSLAPQAGTVNADATASTLIPAESANLSSPTGITPGTPAPGINPGMNPGMNPGNPAAGPSHGVGRDGPSPTGTPTLTFGGDLVPAYSTSTADRNLTPTTPAPGSLTPGTPVGIFDEPPVTPGAPGNPITSGNLNPVAPITGGREATVSRPGSTIAVDPAPSQLVHYVKAKESIWDIAKKYYGDGNKWKAIALANKSSVGSKGELREGVRLVIPDIKPASVVSTTSSSHDTVAPSSSRTITVQSGDTLGKLAQQHLGSSARWNELLKANSDQIKKPEQLKIGMVLRLPEAAAGRATPANTSTSTLTSIDQPTATESGTYTIQSGDTLSSIARKTLGDANRWREIYNANKKMLGSRPQDLKVGNKLIIPSGSARDASPAPTTPTRNHTTTGRSREVAMAPVNVTPAMPTLLDVPATQPAGTPAGRS